MGDVDKIPGIPFKASSERAVLNLKRFACFLPDMRLFWGEWFRDA